MNNGPFFGAMASLNTFNALNAQRRANSNNSGNYRDNSNNVEPEKNIPPSITIVVNCESLEDMAERLIQGLRDRVVYPEGFTFQFGNYQFIKEYVKSAQSYYYNEENRYWSFVYTGGYIDSMMIPEISQYQGVNGFPEFIAKKLASYGIR